MIIWGNHSATQYPDTEHVKSADKLIKNKLENLGTGKDGMKFNFKVTEIKK